MVQLLATQKTNNYKGSWVYYKFIQRAAFEITKRDFEKMASFLGYDKHWASYKIKSWKKDKSRSEEIDSNNRIGYTRDKRTSRF